MRKLTVVAALVVALFVGAGQARADHRGHGHHGHHGHWNGHHGHHHHQHYRPYPVYRSYYPVYDPYCAPPVSIYRPAPVYPYGASFGVSTPRFSFFYGN